LPVFPILHAIHDDDAVRFAYVPIPHAIHDDAVRSAYVPISHAVHKDDAIVFAYVPLLHAIHDDEIVQFAYVPYYMLYMMMMQYDLHVFQYHTLYIRMM